MKNVLTLKEISRFKKNGKKFSFITSGAIQYGLPLNESIEAAEFIWFRTNKKTQRQ